MPKILVVGGNGFLGRHLVSAIAWRGWSWASVNSRSVHPSAYLGDIRAGKFSAVVSVAAHKYQLPEANQVFGYMRTNVFLPRLLASACSVSRTDMVLVGTRWSLGEAGEGPNSLYAATKLLGETAALAHGAGHETAVTVIRIRDLVGPLDPRDNVFRQLLASASSGSALSMTSGHQLIDPIDVRDTATAILDFLADYPKELQGAQFEIGFEPQSIREVASLWQSILGLNLELRWGELTDRGTELYRMDLVHDALPTFRPRSRSVTFQDLSFV